MGSYLDSKTTLDEAISLLPETEQLNLKLFLKNSKTKPRWYATNSFKYSYNGVSLYRLNFTQKETCRINLTVAKADKIDKALLLLPQPLLDYFFENIRKCKHCNPSHGNGRNVIILGNEYYVCAEPEIEISNPSFTDIDVLCEFIEIRKEMIRNIKSVTLTN